MRETPENCPGPDADMTSLWSAGLAPFAGTKAASGEMTTDVAIVGAGVAGLSTALHLGERGIEAVVLEAERPGSAATGASGGILAPEFARNGIAKAVKAHGRERGERLARMVGRSAAFTFDLIARHRIDCDVQQQGFISPGESAQETDALQADGKAWQALGFRVQFLSARETAAAIGSEFYSGALCFEAGGALNPLAYAYGLANAVRKTGVPVFTDSPVLGIEKTGDGWQLRLPEARLRARRVVLAANGGNAALHPALGRTTMPLCVYEYATRPLSDADRQRYLGAGLPYTDRQTYVFSARLDGAGHLISAIPELIPGWNRSRFLREVERRLHDIHAMRMADVEFTWRGTAFLNVSLLPAVYLPEGGLDLIAIQSCNGRGLGVNSILGSEIAELLASGNSDSTAVPLLRPQAIPMHALASRMPKTILSLAQLQDRWRQRRSER